MARRRPLAPAADQPRPFALPQPQAGPLRFAKVQKANLQQGLQYMAESANILCLQAARIAAP